MTAKVMTHIATQSYAAARTAAEFFWQKADEVIGRRISASAQLGERDEFIASLDTAIQEWQTLAVKADKEASAIYNDPRSWEYLPADIQGLKDRRDAIMAAFKEPMSLTTANELINELAEIEMKLAYDVTPCSESDALQEKLSKQWDEIKEVPY